MNNYIITNEMKNNFIKTRTLKIQEKKEFIKTLQINLKNTLVELTVLELELSEVQN